MIKPYIHVLALLVASKCVLEHGKGYSHVGCHVVLVEIAQNSLERAVDHVSVLCSWTGIWRDELMLACFYPPL